MDPLLVRTGGAVRAGGGVLMMAGGYGLATGTSPTFFGIAGGLAVATKGADEFVTGIGQVWTGQALPSQSELWLQQAGLTAGQAAMADAVLSAGLGVGVARVAAARVTLSSAEPSVALYRAVGPAELADIERTQALRNLGSAEGKYFTSSASHASDYARQAVSSFRDPPYTIIETRVPKRLLDDLIRVEVDGGIPAWVIPDERLPGLVPRVLDTMPIPPPRN
jgi:hypothetical protein